MDTPASTPPLARLVRQARQQTGLSQSDFGSLVGKTQAVISRYENGAVEPPGSVIMHCVHLIGSHVAGDDTESAQAMRLEAVETALQSLQTAVRALRRGSARKSHLSRP